MEDPDIERMADHFMPHVKSRLNNRREFVLAGYSFGSLVAIELVRRLESEGFCGRLVLFDGSPEFMKAIATQHFFAETDGQLQAITLLGIIDILASARRAKLQDEFKSCDTWEQRLSAFVNKLPEEMNLNFKVEDQRAICTSIYCRMKALQCYDPSTLLPLRTPITLLRPKVQAVRLMSADYGLGTLTREKVDVYYVDGNHVKMLDEDICAAVINGDHPLENAKLS